MSINEIFFELIRVSLGTQDTLSRPPSREEWAALYAMSKKQSLVGICFAGLQKLYNKDNPEPSTHNPQPSTNNPQPDSTNNPEPITQNLNEVQYLRWLGTATKIQQRNEVLNRRCVELQRMLAADGLRSCILKGQGNSALYRTSYEKDNDNFASEDSINHKPSSINLRDLRQPGDIDAWVDAPREEIIAWAAAHGGGEKSGEMHTDCHVFDDVEVELHFTPSIASSPATNRKLQSWFEQQKEACFGKPSLTPNPSSFNLVYLLHHIFRHYLYEGVGLRQILDYYFVLKEATTELSLEEKRDCAMWIKRLGMERFAGAVIWVIDYVFDGNFSNLSDLSNLLPIAPDEKRGRRLLNVIMEGGNFGHGTKKFRITGWDQPCTRLSRYVRRNWYMLRDYPEEIVWNLLKKLKI